MPMDISKEQRKALKRAYKEKSAEEDLHRRIRNLDDFRRLWKELVPPTGQADSLQGELLRAVENLWDESFCNGNRNFGERHLQQCELLAQTLKQWPDFTEDARDVYGRMIERIAQAGRNSMEYEHLSARERRYYKKPTDCADNYVYDLLIVAFTDFALGHPDVIPFDGYPSVEVPLPPPLSPSARMDQWMKTLFTTYCKPLGYKKEGVNFRLILPDGLGKVINFQRNTYNTAQTCSFIINTGIYFEQGTELSKPKFKEYECQIRNRPRLSAPDPWWTIEEGKPSDAVWAEVDKTFSEAVLPWLNRFPSKAETVKEVISEFERSNTRGRARPLHIAKRLMDCGYGEILLPILEEELAQWQGFSHGQDVSRLIEAIKSKSAK